MRYAAVVQSVRIPACHAGGRGFESRPLRHTRLEALELLEATKKATLGSLFSFLSFHFLWREYRLMKVSAATPSFVTPALLARRMMCDVGSVSLSDVQDVSYEPIGTEWCMACESQLYSLLKTGRVHESTNHDIDVDDAWRL